MKLFIPLVLFLMLSHAEARAQGPSDPQAAGSQTEGALSDEEGEDDQEPTQDKKSAPQEEDKVAAPAILKPLPFGAAYSFGIARKKEGSLDLNAAGYARLEISKKLVGSLGLFKKMMIGLSYSAADIGGKSENNGAYRGSLTGYGLNLSGFTAPRGPWKFKTGASLEITKVRRLPSFAYGNAHVEVNYKPSLSLSQGGYYGLSDGLSIGPALSVQLGGLSGWSLGFEALFAF